MEQQANAYTLFQTAIGLEAQVRLRTDELKSALNRLEQVNDELVAARDAAELANRLKTRFFTAVGHDLLQPLHAARLTLSALERAGEPEDGRLLRQIDHALSTIEELLKTILDLSKLEAGRHARRAGGAALCAVPLARGGVRAPGARQGLGLACRASDIGVRSDPAAAPDDPEPARQRPALHRAGGAVRLVARRRGEAVRIEVWDTGPGIPPAERTRIFEEFQRGSASGAQAAAAWDRAFDRGARRSPRPPHRALFEGGPRHALLDPGLGATALAQAEPFRVSAAGPREAYGFAAAKVLVIDNDERGLEAMRTLLARWK